MDNQINLPPFYVGQKIVCINVDRLNSIYKSILDKTFIVLDTTSRCNCNLIRINSLPETEKDTNRVINAGKLIECAQCGKKFITDGYKRFLASRFKPLEKQRFPLISYSKVLEKERELVGCN